MGWKKGVFVVFLMVVLAICFGQSPAENRNGQPGMADGRAQAQLAVLPATIAAVPVESTFRCSVRIYNVPALNPGGGMYCWQLYFRYDPSVLVMTAWDTTKNHFLKVAGRTNFLATDITEIGNNRYPDQTDRYVQNGCGNTLIGANPMPFCTGTGTLCWVEFKVKSLGTCKIEVDTLIHASGSGLWSFWCDTLLSENHVYRPMTSATYNP